VHQCCIALLAVGRCGDGVVSRGSKYPAAAVAKLGRLSQLSRAQSGSGVWILAVSRCTENIAIKICNPLSPARRDVEVADGSMNVWENVVVIKLRVLIG